MVVRILTRYRFNTVVNLFGLSVGIASCLLIWLFVQNELNYDQHHQHKDRLFRVVSDLKMGGEEDHVGLSSYMLAPTVKQEFPEVEEAVRVMSVGKQTMWVENKPFQFTDNIMTDPGFFSLFDYTFLEGNPATALAEPQCVVITDEVGNMLFGKSTGLIGKTIRYARLTYRITGVVKDIKNNSHLYFHTALSLSSIAPQLEATLRNDWFYLAQTNYLLLHKEVDPIAFDAKLKVLKQKYVTPWLKQVNTEGDIDYHLQPVTDIYLSSAYPAGYAKSGNKMYTIVFTILAVFILLMGCINYINLSIAAAIKRSKEIGVRKTVGASPFYLYVQFQLESIVVVSIGILLALLWVWVTLPQFNIITDKSLSLAVSKEVILFLISMFLICGFLAGVYPAVYLSKLDPVNAIKSQKSAGGITGLIRSFLLYLQLLVSILFLTGTAIVYLQLSFMRNADLGFDKSNLLVVSVPVPDTAFISKFDVLRNELKSNPAIVELGTTSNIPGLPTGTLIHAIETPDHRTMEKAIPYMTVSHDFVRLMGMTIVEGRNFDQSNVTDDTAAFLINEKAVSVYGWKNPLAYTLENGFGHKGKIVGVVKDFHFKSLHEPVEPLVMMLGSRIQGNMLIKIQSDKLDEGVAFVEKTWNRYSKKYPTEYYFLDDRLDKLYRNEEKLMKVFLIFTFVSIILAIVGLYALVTHAIEQRIKEIGIRKVMGASEARIIWEIGRNYLLVFVLAAFSGCAISFWAARKWLESFATRIELQPWMFAAVIFISAGIVITTIVLKSWRTARYNPVESLRYE